MSKRAAIYARVSSDEQAKGSSIPTQIEAMNKYALAQGFKPVQELSEDYTGMKPERPELARLRALVREKAVDAVIVYSSDRFTRNPAHGLLLREELAQAGVELHYVTRGKTEETPEGEMFAGIEDQFNRYWWAKMREASMRGRRGKVEAGIIPGSGAVPYGYTITGKHRETRLVINPEQADIVRMIFRWYAHDGLTNAEITRKLTAMAVPTPGGASYGRKQTGHTEWGSSSVVKLLRHEAYAGVWHAYKYRNKPDGRHVLRPREEWVPINVPVIIDRKTWDKAQERIDQAKRAYIRHPIRSYLLSRRVKCTCGHRATARSNKWKDTIYLYYACNTAERTQRKGCPALRFRADHVEAVVCNWVVQLLNDPRALFEGYRNSQRKLEAENTTVHEQIALVNHQIEKQQKRLAQLLDLYLEGEFGRAVLEQKRTEIERALQTLAEEQARLEEQVSSVCITDEHIASIEELAEVVRHELALADFELKRRLVEALNIQVTLVMLEGQKVIDLHWYAQTDRLCISSGLESSSTRAREDTIQRFQLVCRQLELGCSQRPRQLIRRSRPDDRRRHDRVLEQPCHSDIGRMLAQFTTEAFVSFEAGAVLLDTLLHLRRRAPPCIHLLEHTTEQPTAQRTPGDDAKP